MMQMPLFAAAPLQYLTPSVPAEKSSNMPRMRARAMDKSDFKLLYSLLKEESFDKERVKMIRVACIGNLLHIKAVRFHALTHEFRFL